MFSTEHNKCFFCGESTIEGTCRTEQALPKKPKEGARKELSLENMKRAGIWDKKYTSSSDDSSDSDLEDDEEAGSKKPYNKNAVGRLEKDVATKDNTKKKKGGLVIDYEALSQHGYSGGLSVLKVPLPVVEDEKKDWSWSTGKDRGTDNRGIEESYEVREQTRAALAEGEKLENARTLKEKNLSFSQKEKRKRELGQASRGKNYVEEEKRLLRESGIYSGFDA